MLYQHVNLAAIGYVLPPEILTSREIEEQLSPLYQRLRLPAGRLELMSGIGERRMWAPSTLPSEMSIRSGALALEAAQVDRRDIGLLIHASVCRDHLEPATACRVHHHLGLPPDCLVYDLSNACLGLVNGMLQAANMIELGQITSALIVGTETSRPLLETTISYLNANQGLTRQTVKSAVASLTIGSASAAVVLTRGKSDGVGSPLQCAATRAHSSHHELCHSGRDEAVGDGMHPLMETDSEALLRHGIETGVATFASLLEQSGLRAADFQRTVCHQVGVAHRRALLDALHIEEQNDYVTYPWLGNTGSVALPVTLGVAAARGHFRPQDQVGLFGIGSGINCLMLALKWGNTAIRGIDLAATAGSSLESRPQDLPASVL